MNLIERRRQMMMSKSLPYDAEIEYLESSGTQYIDTLITLASGTTNVKVDFEVEFTDASGISKLCFVSMPNAGLQVYTNNGKLLNQNAPLPVANNSRYVCQSETEETRRTIRVGSALNYSNFSRSISDGAEIYALGGPNFDGSEAKWYSIKLSLNDSVVRDFIPVRVGQVGYMYDKVSGQLFGNQGTGDFVLGPDKN